MNGEGGKARGPLAGIRIMDMTSVVMGPFATQILAAMGADVIKIESPEGDATRHIGPMRHAGMGHLFMHANRGKRSVVLDLKRPDALAAALRLAGRCDVLVSNVRPQAMARLRLDYESLRIHNPRLIHVSCCGYATGGPYDGKPAYDDLVQGAAGVPWLMGRYAGGEGGYAPVTLADRVTGLHAVYAVTTALFERERSGMGQAVVVPMFEAMAQFVMGDHLGGLTFDPPVGPAGYARLLTPHRRPYRTLDGHLCVLLYSDKHWRAFFEAIGDPGRFEADRRFSSQTERSANIDAVYACVASLMLERTTAQWREILDRADIPNMPMNSPQDLLADPHLSATGFFEHENHPTEGAVVSPGAPVAWSRSGCADRSPAPALGQHTREVLQELGYAKDEIASLLADAAGPHAR